MDQICDWPEIAANFDRECEATKKKNFVIAQLANCAGSDVGRARSGTQEPSVSKFVRLCAAIGKTPDQLVFRVPMPSNLPVPAELALNPDDIQRVLRIAGAIASMNLLAPNSLPMGEVFAVEAEAVVKATQNFLAKKKSALPRIDRAQGDVENGKELIGLKHTIIGRGNEQVIEPIIERKGNRSKAEDLRAGEAPAPYGRNEPVIVNKKAGKKKRGAE